MSEILTHEQFAKELTRFGQACSRGDAGQALASLSALLLHDEALHRASSRSVAGAHPSPVVPEGPQPDGEAE